MKNSLFSQATRLFFVAIYAALHCTAVFAGPTTTTLISSANPSVRGNAITLTATVAGSSPTGTVTFKSGPTTLPYGVVALANGIATYSTSWLAVGNHSLTASYSGNSTNSSSVSSGLTQTVNKGPSSVSFGTVQGSSIVGVPFTLRVTVSTPGTLPSGQVTLKRGTEVLGTSTLALFNDYVTFSGVILSVGSHNLSAEYSGDSQSNPSTSPGYVHIVQQVSSVTLTASVNPVLLGGATTLTATVSGANPTGSVVFMSPVAVLGTVPLVGGSAMLSVSSLGDGVGTGLHAIRANYLGDSFNSTAQAPRFHLGVNAPGSTGIMSWQYGYDAVGRRHTVVDPNGLQSTTHYDRLGRPKQIQEPPNVGAAVPTTTDIEFNTADQLVKVVDPRTLQTTFSPNGLGSVTSQTSPDTGTASATFDGAGNVLTSTDARGKVTTRTYDALGRLATVSYTTGTGTTFEYDGGSSPSSAAKGELTKITDESGSTTYAYDALGRLTSKTVASNGRTFVVAYTWGNTGSAMDKLTAITYPSGSRVNYTYDSAGFVSAITVNPVTTNGTGVNTGSTLGMLSSITYNSDLKLKSWAWQDGSSTEFAYDSFGRLERYRLGFVTDFSVSTGGSRFRDLVLDASGRIAGYVSTGAFFGALSHEAFSYDNLGRLLSTTVYGTASHYTYDATGNRTSKIIGGTTYTNIISSANNRLTQVQDVGGTYSITYDGSGNVASDGVNVFVYSDRGRLASATNAGGAVTYKYNGLEQRVSKLGPTTLIPTGAAYFVYDEQGQVLGEYDANGAPVYETAYLGTMPVGVFKRAGTAAGNNLAVSVYNIHADHLGTPRVITRPSDRRIMWSWDSAESFGATAPSESPSGLGVFKYNQRMPGQVFDSETGLFQNWNREYNPRVGRYIQSDPIGLAGGINTYAYVGGNPISFVDPMGLCPWCLPVAKWGLVALGVGAGAKQCADGVAENQKAQDAASKYRFHQQQLVKCLTNPSCNAQTRDFHKAQLDIANQARMSGVMNASVNFARSIPGSTVTGPVPTSVADLVANGMITIIAP